MNPHLRIGCLALLLGLVGWQTGCVNSAGSAYRVRSAHDFEVVETSTKRTLSTREMAALRAKVGAYLAEQGETGNGDFYVKIYLGEEPGIAKGEWVVVRYSRYANTRYGSLASSSSYYSTSPSYYAYDAYPFNDYPYGRFSLQYYDYPYYPYYNNSGRYRYYPPYYPPSHPHGHHGNGDRDRDRDRNPGGRPDRDRDRDRPGQRPDRPSPGSGSPRYAPSDLTQNRRTWTPPSNPDYTRGARPAERDNPRYQGRDRDTGSGRPDYRGSNRRGSSGDTGASPSRRDYSAGPTTRSSIAPSYQPSPPAAVSTPSTTDTTPTSPAPVYTPPATRSNPEPVERQRPAANDGGRRARQF